MTQQSTARVLDIGCGCGSELLWLASRYKADVLGIDLKQERLEVANARAEILEQLTGNKLNCSFQQENLLGLDSTGGFDVVWTQQTFHHLEPRNQIVQKMAELTVSGGYIVIAEVNAWNPLIQMQMLLKRGFKTIKEYTDFDGIQHIYGDERITTPGNLARTFRKHGIETVSTRPFRTMPNIRIADKLIKLEEWLPDMSFLYTNYNYVGYKP